MNSFRYKKMDKEYKNSQNKSSDLEMLLDTLKNAFLLFLSIITYCSYRLQMLCPLTLEVPVTTAADDIHKYFSLFFRENKT